MIFRKPRLSELLKRELNRLTVAIMKFQTAKNIREEHRKKYFSEILLVSALARIPIFPEHMESMYINSAINDLKKTLKFMRQLRELGSNKPYLLLRMREIDEAINILDELVNMSSINYDDVLRKLSRVRDTLTIIYSIVEEHEGIRSS